MEFGDFNHGLCEALDDQGRLGPVRAVSIVLFSLASTQMVLWSSTSTFMDSHTLE